MNITKRLTKKIFPGATKKELVDQVLDECLDFIGMGATEDKDFLDASNGQELECVRD